MQPTAQNGWYLARGGQTYGPYTWQQMAEHAYGGRITRRDKVLDPRTGTWAKPTQVPGLFGSGGVAAAPVGAAAAKIAAGIVLGLAIVLGAVTSVYMWSEGLTLEYLADTLKGAVSFAQDDTPITSATAETPPEGLAFKGTFKWESMEGVDYPNLSHEDTCYLWIYTTDDGTAAYFDFGTPPVNGWPIYLVEHTGSRYVFESSERSLVERVRVVVDVTENGASGEVTKINEVSSFVKGDFRATAITYEQYVAEVRD